MLGLFKHFDHKLLFLPILELSLGKSEKMNFN